MTSTRSTVAALAVLVAASCAARPAGAGSDAGAPLDHVYVYEVAGEVERAGAAADTLSTLQVSGSAQVEVEADEAQVTFAVETEAGTAEEASRRNAERMEAVLTALRETAVPGLELDTHGYSLQPRYRRPDATGLREIDGYRATNMVVATVSDVSGVGSLIDAGVGAGANRVASLSFRASDTEAARLQALREAVDRARSEAEAIAGAMGVSLGRVLEVTGGADPITPMPRFRAEAMVQDASTPIEPGSQTVSASVTVRYALQQGGR